MHAGPRLTAFEFKDQNRPRSDFILKKLEPSKTSKKQQKTVETKFVSNRFQGL